MNNLTTYEKYICNQIELGQLQNYLNSISGDLSMRRKYSVTIQRLKDKKVVEMFHGELIINSDNKYYRIWKIS